MGNAYRGRGRGKEVLISVTGGEYNDVNDSIDRDGDEAVGYVYAGEREGLAMH